MPIERELGHEVAGIWDGGAVHPPGYPEKFAADHNIPRLFASLEEMAAAVDCAIIHGVDWDTHVPKARPFVAAGKSVLIDKPVAGNLADLNQFRQWAAQGARIAGGSSLRFCVETREWLAKPVAERGTPNTVVCGCGVDEFNYGIHAYAMLSGVMGPGIHSVQHLGQGVQHRILVNWQDGRSALLVIGAAASWLPFYATVVTERSCHQYQADSAKLYRALLEAALPYLAGDRRPASAAGRRMAGARAVRAGGAAVLAERRSPRAAVRPAGRRPGLRRPGIRRPISQDAIPQFLIPDDCRAWEAT